MTNEEKFKKALEEIANYNVDDRHGFVDEWNEAASFNECQQIAQKALEGVS